MDKTEWDAMSRRAKDELIAKEVMEKTYQEEDAPPDSCSTPAFTSSRDMAGRVEEKIEQRGLQHEYMTFLWSELCHDRQEVPNDMGWAFRRVSPGLCCYCAVRACEEAKADS